jgi:hypothetical protein
MSRPYAPRSGIERSNPSRRMRTTIAVVALMTLAVGGPFAAVAVRADGEKAHTAGLRAATPAAVLDLDGLVLSASDLRELRVDIAGLRAITWVLYRVDSGEVDRGRAAGATPYVVASSGLRAAGPGRYDLLVTGLDENGDELRRAARFELT